VNIKQVFNFLQMIPMVSNGLRPPSPVRSSSPGRPPSAGNSGGQGSPANVGFSRARLEASVSESNAKPVRQLSVSSAGTRDGPVIKSDGGQGKEMHKDVPEGSVNQECNGWTS
jgi:hypothetical protein